MRAAPAPISAAEARAAATAVPYDQLMAVYPSRIGGTDAFVRIYNNDGSEAGACGNGMRCVADILFKESGNPTLMVETRAGLLACYQGRRGAHLDGRHGRAALPVERDPARRGILRYAGDRTADRADRPSDFAFALCGQHGQSPRGVLGRRRRCLRSRQDRPDAGKSSDLSRAREYFARQGRGARAPDRANLGARRGPHPRLRLGRLCRRGVRRRAPSGPTARSR